MLQWILVDYSVWFPTSSELSDHVLYIISSLVLIIQCTLLIGKLKELLNTYMKGAKIICLAIICKVSVDQDRQMIIINIYI